MINRGPIPVQQQHQQKPQQALGQHQQQEQYQQINRAPLPVVSQQAQIPQQRPPPPPQLIRTPIQPQVQNLNSSTNPTQANYQVSVQQNRPPQPIVTQQQYPQNFTSDGQGVQRVNQQYRPQIQTQQRPINPAAYNPNIHKLPVHLEDRTKMATEAANPNQPSYLISNTDDVDDVIVRPIGNVSVMKFCGRRFFKNIVY